MSDIVDLYLLDLKSKFNNVLVKMENLLHYGI